MAANHAMLDERAFGGVKRAALAGLDGTELLRRTAEALRAAVPFDAYFAATVDPFTLLISRSVAGVGRETEGARVEELGLAYFEEGLGFASQMAGRDRSAKIQPAVTGREVERSPVTRGLRRGMGFDHELGALFVSGRAWGGMEVVRERGAADFAAREARLARRIAPLVGAGLRAAVLRREAASAPESRDPDVPGVITLDARRRVVSHTPGVEGLLSELGDFDAHSWRRREPPAPVVVVDAAVRRSLMPRSDRDLNLVPRLRLRGRRGRWLTLHASLLESAGGRPGETVVVLEPTRPQELARISVSAYGLSPREEEVVKLVASGLATRGISQALYLSEYTVQKHLQNAFEKAGVGSRAELLQKLFFKNLPSGMLADH